MCAIGMVIRDAVFDETAQVSLVEDECVIQKIAATASDPSFRHTIAGGAESRISDPGFGAGREGVFA